MKKVYLSLAFLLFSFILSAQKLPFQGYMEEAGVPVNGVRTFSFELTDYGWSETITEVTIDNGIYNVVLGEITLLPDSIFDDISETPLSITVDSTNIGIVTLYKPLGLRSLSTDLILENETGLKRGEFIVNPNDAGELKLFGPNDLENIKLGNVASGYLGDISVFDSLGVASGFLRARNNGGLLQLQKRENGNFASAIVASANTNLSNLSLYGQNITSDGVSLMIENYITANEIAGGPLMTGNYLRSGTDWKDNENRTLVAIGNSREEGGSDPTGTSGFLSLWGTNTFNAELAGKRGENNDLPVFNMFGNNDGGARNISIGVNTGAGTDNSGDIELINTDNGGIASTGLVLTSNLNGNDGGGIELLDSTGVGRVILDGASGDIASYRASDGGRAVGLFQNAGNGGIAIQNAADENTFFYEAGSNILELKSGGTTSIKLDGTNFGNSEIRGSLQVDDLTTFNMQVIGEIRSDDVIVGNFFNINGIRLEATTGNIDATGLITAEVAAGSDRRYKKQITTLENSLSNTLKLRGTSYYWKDENKTDRRQIGVIAQEVEEIYPEFVHTNEEGYKAVNYSQMTAVLIEAIKELNQKVEDLEIENEELSTALSQQATLNERILKLEKMLLENEEIVSKQ